MDKESVKIITDGAVKICKVIVRGLVLVSIIHSTKIVVGVSGRNKNEDEVVIDENNVAEKEET